MKTSKRQYCYILFNKPYGVLCQFSSSGNKKTLADFCSFPKDVYPAGRLDEDSEGLVLLTNDGKLKHFLLEPKYQHPRTYLAQIENIPSEEALDKLRCGVIIEGRKTLPADVQLLTEEPKIHLRSVPIRFRKSVPTSWLEITLREGRNRQVRKMTAAIGHPTLRLIRIRIGPLKIDGMQTGDKRYLTEQEAVELKEFVSH